MTTTRSLSGPPGSPSRRYALLGWPLDRSLSPAMFRAAHTALGIHAHYERRPTPPDRLAAVMEELRSGALDGANVTIPHKAAVLSHVDERSVTVDIVRAIAVRGN